MNLHKIIIYILIVSLFSLEFLYSTLHLIPRFVKWTPEFLSLVSLIIILLKIVTEKKNIYIEAKYLYLFFFLLLIIVTSILYNKVHAGTLIQGLRRYFKTIPFLLLPIVYPLNGKELKKIFHLLLICSFIQVPISLWQRFVLSKDIITGDFVTGTLGHGASGFLSIFLTSVIGFLTSFYINKKISTFFYIFTLLILIIPCAINETKITFLLLPIAITFPIIFSQRKVEKIIPIILLLTLFISSSIIIKNIYDKLMIPRWGYGISGFVQNETHFQKYVGGRLDPLRLTLIKGVTDIEILLFGKGIGNASIGFTEMLSGKSDIVEQADKFAIGDIGFNTLVWEIGTFATFLYFMFHLFVFVDSYILSKLSHEFSSTALGMLPFITIYTITYFYNTAFHFNLLNYMFFYLSGIIIINKYKLRHFSNSILY